MAHNKAYYKAEKKIEAAQQSEAKVINLSGQWEAKDEEYLTELPESLRQLTKLQSLNLSLNHLTVIPEWLGQLTKLQSLNLSRNQLRVIPEWLGQLTKLQLLDISQNHLVALPESLEQLTKLNSLSLSDNQLTVLPKSLRGLIQLEVLNLYDNQVSIIPSWINNLTNLHTLNWGGNKLTELSDPIRSLRKLKELQIWDNKIQILPEWIGELYEMEFLNIHANQFNGLPESLSNLPKLKSLYLGYARGGNPMKLLPESLKRITLLKDLAIGHMNLTILPEWISELNKLTILYLNNNNLTDLPVSLAQLKYLKRLDLDKNPLNPELVAAYKEGLPSIMAYLRAKAKAQITLNEAKLILVGEGEVGKTCLMDALVDNPWQEHNTTHGIEIKQIKVTDSGSKKEITLNGWDFGGQRVYRPTHQLFFSAPAVYLVVWKPREGPQQGFVKEWIKLIKHREPDAKILVVATHGGPGGRQPDIDRQELLDLFGKDTVIDFFFVESKPEVNGYRKGIEELKQTIARIAFTLPEIGRSVPKSFQDARKELQKIGTAYLPLETVLVICHQLKMENETARLFVNISHRLGHLIYYEHDPALRDIVVLKPDWLSTAMSFVLDDEGTRKAHGLISFSRMNQLWNDPSRQVDSRYPLDLHKIFLRLMERFDLSYRVVGLSQKDDSDTTSLIAQLVPDNRPEKDLEREWSSVMRTGDIQQVQICRIVDARNGQSATAEGLFYQLIVRLHKYSLGRINYKESVHWQRGLVVDDEYNGRALLEYIGNDVRITVRAPYPERFLSVLTSEVKYLVDSFWTGLRCDVMVPCVEPCGKNLPGSGLFEVEKLIESKRRNRDEYPCPVCNEWQNIDYLLRNAPAVRPIAAEVLFAEYTDIKRELVMIRQFLMQHDDKAVSRFDRLDVSAQRILSKVDDAYTGLMQAFTDEAKEGPRLFSFVPVDRKVFNPKEWTSSKFRLTLWCEHSRLPLPSLNEKESKNGVYEIDLSREWLKKASPYLKLLTGTLSLILPVASSAVKLALDDNAYKAIEEQLDFSKEAIDASLEGSEKIGKWLGGKDTTSLEYGESIRAQGATLRELHTLLKTKDAGFGGLVRVMNKRQEFLWVHKQFEKEY